MKILLSFAKMSNLVYNEDIVYLYGDVRKSKHILGIGIAQVSM